jgi:hypothetical protein
MRNVGDAIGPTDVLIADMMNDWSFRARLRSMFERFLVAKLRLDSEALMGARSSKTAGTVV